MLLMVEIRCICQINGYNNWDKEFIASYDKIQIKCSC